MFSINGTFNHNYKRTSNFKKQQKTKPQRNKPFLPFSFQELNETKAFCSFFFENSPPLTARSKKKKAKEATLVPLLPPFFFLRTLLFFLQSPPFCQPLLPPFFLRTLLFFLQSPPFCLFLFKYACLSVMAPPQFLGDCNLFIKWEKVALVMGVCMVA